MPLIRRGLLSLACLLVFALSLRSASAASSEPWSALAHTSFRHQTDVTMGVGTSLAQDNTGFIWLGTQTGLVRWDGYRQRRYLADSTKPGTLPDSYIVSLRVDGRGRVWVGTSSGGLARYDAATDRFVTIPTGPQGLSHGRISAMADDGRGGIWVGTGGGLEQIKEDGSVHAATSGAPRIAASALAKGGIDSLLRDRNGGLWIGTRSGLFYRAADTDPVKAVSLVGAGETQPAVASAYQDSQGRIWIGTRSDGAFVIERPGAAPRAVVEAGTQGSLQRERVFSIVEKVPNIMWLGTEGGGIVEVDTRDGSTRRIRHQADVQDSLVDNDVVAMMRDRSGQVFVATVDALSQHDPRPQGVTTVRSTGTPGKLSVMSLLAAPSGQAWLGIGGGAVEIVDPRTGRVSHIQANAQAGALPKGRILSIAHAADGTIYIGTQHGLYRSDADGGNVRRVTIPGRSVEAAVWAMAWSRGVLWLGGHDGIWGVSMEGEPRVLRHEESTLGDSRVITILPTADDGVWIGTAAGLARLHPAGGKVEVVPTDATDTTRLPPGYVSSLLLDRKGRLWISHFSTGISVLERTDGAKRHWFKRLGVADGLPDHGVNVLVADRGGQIWMSTDNGLASIDPDTYKVRKLSAADGVHVQTYWSGAGALAKTGEILFGGLTGLTVIHPDRLERKAAATSLAVTQVMLGGRDIPVAPFNRSAVEPVTVSPDDRERGLALEFAPLDFSAPGLYRYSYRLEGFDRDWIDTDNGTRRVGYNNLPPGNYTLQLRAASTIGGQVVGRSLRVQVQPAWHQTIWVRGLGVAGVLVLAAAMAQFRISMLRRRQRELEQMVDARTAELQATQTKLETMAYCDAMTGLANRRRFNDELRSKAADAEAGGERFTLILIDLDHFKAINDTLGHDAGDALLMIVAERLLQAMRDTDLVVRLGGDEFAVLVSPSCDDHTIGRICQRIVSSLSKPVSFGEHTMNVSASLGAASFTRGPQALERMYKAADEALYESKKAGRNGWRMSENAAAA